MSNNISSGQKSPDTVAESLISRYICASTVNEVTAEALSRPRFQPCGDTPESSGKILADGGTQYVDLSGFQRDLLLITLRITTDPTTDASGTKIRERLEAHYGEEINRSRLYKNIHTLADLGLLSESTIDGRTNCYELTADAKTLLHTQLKRLVDTLNVEGENSPQSMADSGQPSVTKDVDSQYSTDEM